MSTDFDKSVEELQESILQEARNIYTKQVIDHWMFPRNFDGMPDPDGFAEHTGPCGDTMKIYLKVNPVRSQSRTASNGVKDNQIADATFLTDGCGTTIACGSIITELVKGKALLEAREITKDTVLKVAGGLPEADQHCAILAATTLQKAIAEHQGLKKEPWKKHYRNVR